MEEVMEGKSDAGKKAGSSDEGCEEHCPDKKDARVSERDRGAFEEDDKDARGPYLDDEDDHS